MVKDGVRVPESHQEVKSGRSKEGCDLLEITFHKVPPGLGALGVEIEHGSYTFIAAWKNLLQLWRM